MTITEGAGTADLAAPGSRTNSKQADALRTLRWLRYGAILAPLLLTAIFGAVVWRDISEDARLRAQNNAVLVGEYMERLIRTQDVALIAAEEAMLRFRPDGTFDRQTHLFLRRLAEGMGSHLGIAFADPEGRFLVASSAYPLPPDASPPRDRDYIRAAEAGTELFIDRVTVQPQDVDALVIARRPRGETFTGVWVSAVPIEVLAEFLTRIASGPGESASVIRADGRLLVRHVPLEGEVTLGRDQPTMQAIEAGLDRAILSATASTDGVRRLYALEQIGSLPVYGLFGISRDAMVREWFVSTGTVAALLGLFGYAGYQLTRFAARNVRAEAAQAALALDRRLLAEAEKTAALKDTMLKELHHRVKNSLQMIQSLIRLQSHREEGPDLDEISRRVLAIASIHDLLYRSSSSFDVDFAALIRSICENEAIRPPDGTVAVGWRAEPLVLDVSQATPLALCAVELVTNAAKHAFGPGGGRIEVAVEVAPGGRRATLTVSDNGRGMPAAPARNSGLRVVDALVRQLEATIEVVRDGGTRVAITFPVETGARSA